MLCDGGATIECIKDLMGVVPGTPQAGSDGPLSVADEGSARMSLGSNIHALTRRDALGQHQDFAAVLHHTPKIIVDVLSEGIECNTRGTRIEWSPNQPRMYHTANGQLLTLAMSQTSLGMLTIMPLFDKARLAALIKSSPLLRDIAVPAAVNRPVLINLISPPAMQKIPPTMQKTSTSLTLTEALNKIICSHCRTNPCKCRDDVEDVCRYCDNNLGQ